MLTKNINFMNYLDFSKDKSSLFYTKPKKINSGNKFTTPNYNVLNWSTYSDPFWSYMIFKEANFPAQGWKIHITTDQYYAQDLLYDIAEFLISQETSFKYVPNLSALQEKNAKYANRSASGKFITVYPKDTETFCLLLDKLKNITDQYPSGPYILNDKQWRESNVFFRYGGLKRIITKINGKDALAIQLPNGEYVEDKRVPYYYLPPFVQEPEYIKSNNELPSAEVFKKIQQFEDIEAIHFSNGGGVYSAKYNGKKIVLKEGRLKAGLDATKNDGFQRNRNEFKTLKRLKKISGVINAAEYFQSWQHNYFIEDYNNGETLQSFIVRNFPFTSLDNSEKRSNYIEKARKIIEQLGNTIKQIHEEGLSIGDLSLSNIMVSTNRKIKVTLIDFEAARPAKDKYQPRLATPSFFSKEAKTFEENDWFAFYRIVRYIFLPINSVNEMAPQLENIQDKKIEAKFGKQILALIYQVKNYVAKFTNLSPVSPNLNRKLSIPQKELQATSESISFFKINILRGIWENLDTDSFILAKGSVEQYSDNMNQLNISHGAFGVILSLLRTPEISNQFLTDELHEWLDKTIPYIKDLSANTDGSHLGLFNGLTGISSVLYELGYTDDSLIITNNVYKNINENTNDTSIYSGLSGIGLQSLSVYAHCHLKKHLTQTKVIAEKIVRLFKQTVNNSTQKNDYGLITGWAGSALFLWKYSLITKNASLKEMSIDILNFSLSSLSTKTQNMNAVFSLDKSSGFLNPYLKSGSSGICLVLLEMEKDDPSILSHQLKQTLQNLLTSNNIFCSFDAGLFEGYTGFLPLAIAKKSLTHDNESLSLLLSNLNNYILRDDDSQHFLLPGKKGYKCSMDLSTGAGGLLLLLNDIDTNKWNSWFPILNTINLFTNDSTTLKGMSFHEQN